MTSPTHLDVAVPPGPHWLLFVGMFIGLGTIDVILAHHVPAAWPRPVGLLSLGIFVSEIRQALFVRDLDPKSSGVWMTVVGAIFTLLGQMTTQLWLPSSPSWILQLLGYVFVLGAQFSMRRSLDTYFNSDGTTQLRIDALLLLIFGFLYLQFQFTKIRALNRAEG